MNPQPIARRQWLRTCGLGLGSLALLPLLEGNVVAAADTEAMLRGSLAPREPHFPARAKHVIHIFLNGGMSQVDSFDPKPALDRYNGQTLPMEYLKTERRTGAAFASPFKFSKQGQSGIEVSELFPHVGKVIDDVCVIRSMVADVPNHEPSLMLMNCGDARQIRPCLGSWLTYGLGTENQNLPGFVAMCPSGYPIQESQNWQAGFLPGAYQGTYLDSQHTEVTKLIENIRNPKLELDAQRRQLELLQKLNRQHAELRGHDARLEARIASFELAYRMQTEAMEAFDLSHEPQSILDLYGEGVQARQMLIARRLVERGVRFVQLWHGSGQPWDSHDDLEKNHRKLAKECDQGIAALLQDLKQRGLLNETLVIFGGEFGRTPTVELPTPGLNAGRINGRDHNPYGFTMCLAGGGVRGGHVHGATDEFGFRAVENPVHVHDLHATILKLCGFDHQRLTYRWAGRDFRLTDVYGKVVDEIIA